MGRYARGFSVSGVNTANTQTAVLAQTTTASRLRILQIAVGVAAAPTTAPSFYLTRTTARGTQTTTAVGLPFDENDPASGGSLDTAWSVAPTFASANKLTSGGLATTAGGYWIWDFRDEPIVVDANTAKGLAIVNANASGTTTGTFTGHFIWEE